MKYIDKIKDKKILAVLNNYTLHELTHKYIPDGNRFITIDDKVGARIYERGVLYIFYMALRRLNPESKMDVFHSLSKGIYIEIEGMKLDHFKVDEIYKEMKKITKEALKFEKIECSIKEAKEIYKKQNLEFKNKIIDYKYDRNKVTMYKCDKYYNYFYGYMVPDTSYIDLYELVYYSPGIILRFKNYDSSGLIPPFKEEPKIHFVHKEAEKWADLHKVGSLYGLNKMIENKKENDFISVIEALQEKKIASIADKISNSLKRIILIAGPSSSGKTTFANRLSTQLRALNLNTHSISLDNYFVNRDKTPLDENGDYDFESIHALDLEKLNSDLTLILEGEEVKTPIFDFHTGSRKKDEFKKIKIDKCDLLILEGIHGLNDELTKDIFIKDKFKIYISALTQLNLDMHNRITTTDNRLIRRIVRDNRTRSYKAEDTLKMWDNVGKGERKYIFPFQEKADEIFNSALVYDFSVLKKYALPLLMEVDKKSEVYYIAKRLIKFLNYFVSLENEEFIPKNSIIREFIGGGLFE